MSEVFSTLNVSILFLFRTAFAENQLVMVEDDTESSVLELQLHSVISLLKMLKNAWCLHTHISFNDSSLDTEPKIYLDRASASCVTAKLCLNFYVLHLLLLNRLVQKI